MENQNKEAIKASELEALKNDMEFTELEDRLEMVQAAAAESKRCCNDECSADGMCK